MSQQAIDRYIDSIFSRHQTALRELTATLAEPHADEVESACHRLDMMIETLTAFAIGHAVGRVAEVMRRIDATLDAPIGRAMTGTRLASGTIPPLPPLRYLADADRRPLVDARGRDLWAAWSRRVRGTPVQGTREFILRVA